MKPVSQEKSHCFKHACTYPKAEPMCPYCRLDVLEKEKEKYSRAAITDKPVIAAKPGSPDCSYF